MFGAPELDDFTEQALTKTKDLRDRITVSATTEFNKPYPEHYGAAVIIDGHRCVSSDAYGDPEKPMSQEAVVNKAVKLMTYAGMSAAESKDLSGYALIADLDNYLSGLP